MDANKLLGLIRCYETLPDEINGSFGDQILFCAGCLETVMRVFMHF